MVQNILPDDLKQWQEAGAQLIDVREPFEYDGGHVPGTENIPLDEIFERKDELKEPIVVICATGNRSGQAANYLSSQGFDKVANLMGGTDTWARRGYPLE